jgi:tripartite-type tricarboxylate transporter receptor subunit TctC
MLRRTLLGVLLGAVLAALSWVCAAQDYPSRPIQMVIPFAAGGGFDLTGRQFAKLLSEILKQPVVVTNRNGAAGTIGLTAVAGATADGYTVAYSPAVSVTSEPHRVKTAYNVDSFRYVCQVIDNIFAIGVLKDSPYQSLAQLVADAKRDPGKLSYGSAGTGSIPHLAVSDLEAATGVQFTHVPYRGDGAMQQDLFSGRLSFGAVLSSSFSGQLKAGALRLLAVFSEQRHPGFPNVPSLTDLGIPIVQLSFGGLMVPAKTPPEIVATLESACEKAVKARPLQEWAANVNQVLSYRDSAGFTQRIRKDSEAKAATLKRLNLAS